MVLPGTVKSWSPAPGDPRRPLRCPPGSYAFPPKGNKCETPLHCHREDGTDNRAWNLESAKPKADTGARADRERGGVSQRSRSRRRARALCTASVRERHTLKHVATPQSTTGPRRPQATRRHATVRCKSRAGPGRVARGSLTFREVRTDPSWKLPLGRTCLRSSPMRL